MLNKLKSEKLSKIWHNVILIKVVVMLGLASIIFLPAEYAYAANLTTNLLWLWKT